MSDPYRTNSAPPIADERKPIDALGRTLEAFERYFAGEITYDELHEELDFNWKLTKAALR